MRSLPADRAEVPAGRRVEAAYGEGISWLLMSLLVVIVLSLLSDFIYVPQHYIKYIATALMLVGLARMFFPYLRAERAETFDGALPRPARRGEAGARTFARADARYLPEHQGVPVSEFAYRAADTAEMLPVPSVTERTTNLLDDPPGAGGRRASDG